jgi:hypothetical protein
MLSDGFDETELPAAIPNECGLVARTPPGPPERPARTPAAERPGRQDDPTVPFARNHLKKVVLRDPTCQL